MSKRKGNAYEREIAHKLNTKRNYQYRAGDGADLYTAIGQHKFAVECKRRRSLSSLYQWMEQAQRAAADDAIPIVIARADRCDSLVIISLEDFLHLLHANRTHDTGAT